MLTLAYICIHCRTISSIHFLLAITHIYNASEQPRDEGAERETSSSGASSSSEAANATTAAGNTSSAAALVKPIDEKKKALYHYQQSHKVYIYCHIMNDSGCMS